MSIFIENFIENFMEGARGKRRSMPKPKPISMPKLKPISMPKIKPLKMPKIKPIKMPKIKMPKSGKSKSGKSKKGKSKKGKSTNNATPNNTTTSDTDNNITIAQLKQCTTDKEKCQYDLADVRRGTLELAANNNRLITKNNSLLDTIQFYRKSLFGSSKTTGYKDATIKANKTINKLKHKEIGPYNAGGRTRKARTGKKREKKRRPRNAAGRTRKARTGKKRKKKRRPKRQGFTTIEGFDSTDAAYKAVATQNTALTNQIYVNKNKYSVDNQLYINIAKKRDTLLYTNKILLWIFYIVITVCSVYIFMSSSLTSEQKFVVFKLVWLFVVILEIAEYLLYYAFQYANAFIRGVPYSYENYWTFTLSF